MYTSDTFVFTIQPGWIEQSGGSSQNEYFVNQSQLWVEYICFHDQRLRFQALQFATSRKYVSIKKYFIETNKVYLSGLTFQTLLWLSRNRKDQLIQPCNVNAAGRTNINSLTHTYARTYPILAHGMKSDAIVGTYTHAREKY